MRRKIAFILIVVMFCYNTLNTADAVLKKESTDNISREHYKIITATTSDANKSSNSNASKKDKDTIDISTDRNMVCQVSFPISVHACLDPGNILGKGQVFSDSYIIENYGKNDIAVKIKNIQVTCELSEETNDFFDEEISDILSDTKKIDIQMVWKNETEQVEKILMVEDGTPDKYVLFLKGAKYNKNNEYIRLNEGSKGLFYFTGTLSNNPNISWENSELSVKFDYEIEIEENDEEAEEIDDFIEDDNKYESREDEENISEKTSHEVEIKEEKKQVLEDIIEDENKNETKKLEQKIENKDENNEEKQEDNTKYDSENRMQGDEAIKQVTEKSIENEDISEDNEEINKEILESEENSENKEKEIEIEDSFDGEKNKEEKEVEKVTEKIDGIDKMEKKETEKGKEEKQEISSDISNDKNEDDVPKQQENIEK